MPPTGQRIEVLAHDVVEALGFAFEALGVRRTLIPSALGQRSETWLVEHVETGSRVAPNVFELPS
jgi:hypothetical protein